MFQACHDHGRFHHSSVKRNKDYRYDNTNYKQGTFLFDTILGYTVVKCQVECPGMHDCFFRSENTSKHAIVYSCVIDLSGQIFLLRFTCNFQVSWLSLFFSRAPVAAESRIARRECAVFFTRRISAATTISHLLFFVAWSCLDDSVLLRVHFALCAVDMFQPHARAWTKLQRYRAHPQTHDRKS